MTTVRSNQEIYTVPVIPGIPTGNSNNGSGNGSGVTPESEQILSDLLREYEKAKAAIAKAFLENQTEGKVKDLKGSALDKALGHNPVWQSLTATSTPTTPEEPEYQPKDIKNFFFLIFKFLRDHQSSDAKLQVAQAVHMLAQTSMLDDVTKESESSLDKMKHDIHHAERRAHSPLAIFLKIGLPILLAFLSIAVIIGTMGTAAPAAAAAEAAAETAAETAVEAGSSAATSAASATTAGITEGLEAGAEGAIQVGTEGMSTATQATTSTLTSAIRTGLQQAVAKAGEYAGQAATFVANGAGRGALAATLTVGLSAGLAPMAAAAPAQQEAQAIQTATTLEQGEMAINAAASDSLQTGLKGSLQTQDNAQQESTADASLLQQMIQAMTKVLYLGNY